MSTMEDERHPVYRSPEALAGAAVFDPTCVILGTDVIDWGSFGFGNTVLIDPLRLGVRWHSVERAARNWAKERGFKVSVGSIPGEVVPDGSRQRKNNERRAAVCFTRKHMVELTVNQGEWLGAVERQS